MMGTPAYMSPEQVLGREIDARADLYAMGVVFYRLTTAKLPFKGDSPFAMAQSQVNDPPTPVGLMRAGLPPWVEQVLGRALSKAPEDRFQTADEFRETIKRGLAGLPIDAAPNAFVPAELMLTSLPGRMPVLPSPGQPLTGSTPASTSGAIPTVPTGAVPTVSTGAVPAAPTGSVPAVSTDSVPVMPSGPVPLQPTTGRIVDPDMTVMTPQGQPPGMGTGANDLTVMARSGAIPAMGTGQIGAPGQTGATATGTGANAMLQTGSTAASQLGEAAVGQTGATAAGQTGAAAAMPAAAQKSSAAKKSSLPLVGIAAGVVVIGAVAWFLWARSHANPASASTPIATATDAASATLAPAPTDATGTPPPSVASATDPVSTPPAAAAGAGTTAGTTAGAGTTGGALTGRPDSSGALPPSTAAREKSLEAAEPLLVYSDAKLLVINGNKAQEQDVIINFVAGQVSMAPKKGGSGLWSLACKKVAHATYIRAKDPKWDITLPAPPDNLDIPGFMRGARHWLVIQAKTANPGYVILRLDDSNWSDVLDTLEARSGVKVDRLPSGGK
jgi:serine/threonine-protein kinase